MEKFVPIFACLVASFDVRAMNVSCGEEGRIFNVLGGIYDFGRIWEFLNLAVLLLGIEIIGVFFFVNDEGRKEIVGVKCKSFSVVQLP